MGTVAGGADRISELPDPLLDHILSFLPTKTVVSTSILSKRWKYVWTSVPVLHFRERDWRTYEGRLFLSFMDIMLSLHNMTNIQKFYLECERLISHSRVVAWISSVLRHNNNKLEEVIILSQYLYDSDSDSLFRIPQSLLTCQSLTLLELEMRATLQLSESISIPRLKILRLSNIKFVDKKLTHKFFSNFSVLEELKLTWCYFMDMKVVSISAPALKRLFINGIDGCGISIYAPSLLSLRYGYDTAKNLFLHRQHSFSSLVDAVISIRLLVIKPLNAREEMGYASAKLLEYISNVKLLKMCDYVFQALTFPDDIFRNLPTFHNLIHLEVTSKINLSTIGTLLGFLRVTPNLESLVFAEGVLNVISDWTLDVVPHCLLLKLNSVEIHEYIGSKTELNLVKLFLTSARVLHKMAIIFTSRLRKYRKNELMQQVLMFPRGSTSCVVDFTSRT